MSNFVTDLMSNLFLIDQENRGYIVFVRHGESERQSKPEDDHDSFDTTLSENGRRQARAVANRLKERSIDVLYSSPLKRAYETAEKIGDLSGMNVTVEKDLREVDIDREEALKATADETFFENLSEDQTSINEFRWGSLPFAESSESLRERVTTAVDNIVEKHPGDTIVIVAHTGVINAYLTECIGLDSDFITLPAHTSISTVRTREDRRVVVTINDYSHLR